MTSRLILICHASTDAMRKSAFPQTSRLTVMVRHARRLWLNQMPAADRCWVSPELRTRQTAEALQLKAIALSMLHECDYGDWRGSSFDEVTTSDPDGVSRWRVILRLRLTVANFF